MKLSVLRNLLDLLVRRVLPSIRDVVFDRFVEEDRILGDDSDSSTKRRLSNLGDILTVDPEEREVGCVS